MLLECARESYKNNQNATKNSINELKEKFQDESSSSAASYTQIEFFGRENKIIYWFIGMVKRFKYVIKKLDFETAPTIQSIVKATKNIGFQERLNLLTTTAT